MKGGLKGKLILNIAVSLCAIYVLLPTLLKLAPDEKIPVLHNEKVRLGLDLQGGTHLLLEVKAEEAVYSVLERLKNELKDAMKKKEIYALSLERSKDKLYMQLLNEEMSGPFEELLKEDFSSLRVMGKQKKADESLIVELSLLPEEEREVKEMAVEQALETIRNRVDQLGVLEPEIARQGENRILVQLPGIKDPERAKAVIGKTAMLEFKLVDEEHPVEEALAGRIPEGSVLLHGIIRDRETGRVRKIPYLLKEPTLLTGDALSDARVAFDQFNRPYISLKFTSWGAKEFERITGENVGKRLAIILDGTVYSAPVIRERISGGRAMIEGDFTLEEARDLAVVLRAGALPAPVSVLEERTVGPSLGKDLVNKGFKAIVIGALLVLVFMILYYRWAGVIADLALVLNVLLVLAIMILIKATLTLPGVAGLALTVGMSIDANILIFERIKEELRGGRPFWTAVDLGYSRALTTILDAQITTLIAAAVLFQFGTGPIRGFAVTLTLGILTNLFTAIVTTKTVFDLLRQGYRLKELRI